MRERACGKLSAPSSEVSGAMDRIVKSSGPDGSFLYPGRPVISCPCLYARFTLSSMIIPLAVRTGECDDSFIGWLESLS